MMKIIYGILCGIAAYGFIVFVYSEGFEAGRDHQLKIDCEARGLIFHNRICWVVPRDTELRGTL